VKPPRIACADARSVADMFTRSAILSIKTSMTGRELRTVFIQKLRIAASNAENSRMMSLISRLSRHLTNSDGLVPPLPASWSVLTS
jgi:hypothetical protein